MFSKNLMSPRLDLCRLSNARSLRASSWDRSGRNFDFVNILPGQTHTLLETEGSGCINHIYWTMIWFDPLDLRSAILRMFWDGEEQPSVEVPLGDFFCVSNCVVRTLNSEMMCINPGMGGSYGFNCYFPMPFSRGARIEIENQGEKPLGGPISAFWYHVDYELWEENPPDDLGRFHAQFNRENLTGSVDPEMTNVHLWMGANLTGEDNYVLLDAEGHGRLAGILLEIDNVAGGWYGEGDDMIFIDGDTWPPSLHGTGTEEIFAGGASPTHEYNSPYAGFHLVEDPHYSGKNAMYRWYVHDPIHFKKSIRVTVEHGHANNFENDYASVAYWYQAEPHKPFPDIPDLKQRMPIVSEQYNQVREKAQALTRQAMAFIVTLEAEKWRDIEIVLRIAWRHLHEGRTDEAITSFNELETVMENI